MPKPDVSVLDLHSVDEGPCPVIAVSGEAWWGSEDDEVLQEVCVGDEIPVGYAVVIAAGGLVQLPGLVLKGGNCGRAHALVSQANFQATPSRRDVPRLIAQLEQIEREMGGAGDDPLMMQSGPSNPVEHAQSAEFARLNLDPKAAQLLPKDTAEAMGAVCLFSSQDTVFVAVAELSVGKLRTLMQTLDRPVNPHVVSPSVLEALLRDAYQC